MAKETVRKTAYCKRAQFSNSKSNPTLQSRLSAAIGKRRKVGERKEHLPGSNYVKAIIYHRSEANMFFGILASYERGNHQLTIADDDDAEILTLDQVAPPENNDKKRQEFLDGVCYFCVAKNHVVLVPSRSLSAKPLEQHLNWLLRDTQALEETNRVALSDTIVQATRERIRTAHVKEVEIGAPFIEGAKMSPSSESPTDKSTMTFFGKGVDIVKQLLPPSEYEKLKLGDLVDGNVEVTLKIKYKRTTTEKTHKALDDLALALRNLDEDEVKLLLKGGSTVEGSTIKLSDKLGVEAKNGIPDHNQMFEQMRKWIIELLESKAIEP